MTVMVTGHRKIIPANNIGSAWPEQNPSVKNHHRLIKEKISEIVGILHLKYLHNDFISGMALGADQIFAQAVLDMTNAGFHGIRLIAAIPFVGQESKWPPKSQEKYKELLNQVSHIEIVSSGGYSPEKMQTRNIWMVDRSHIVLAVWDGSSGGTKNCVNYAIKQRKTILHLNSETLELTGPAL